MNVFYEAGYDFHRIRLSSLLSSQCVLVLCLMTNDHTRALQSMTDKVKGRPPRRMILFIQAGRCHTGPLADMNLADHTASSESLALRLPTD